MDHVNCLLQEGIPAFASKSIPDHFFILECVYG